MSQTPLLLVPLENTDNLYRMLSTELDYRTVRNPHDNITILTDIHEVSSVNNNII